MTTDQLLPGGQREPVISLRNLRVSYGDREILHGISFDVLQGETLVILGGSGSGKSTLLRTLVGLEQPSAGDIWIKGRNIATTSAAEMDEIRKKIGMSFQGILHTFTAQRRHEEARRGGSRLGDGPGDPVF